VAIISTIAGSHVEHYLVLKQVETLETAEILACGRVHRDATILAILECLLGQRHLRLRRRTALVDQWT